jgi:hypothetical protein
MKEIEFRKLLDSLDDPHDWSYEYVDNCTDEFSKGAKYEFYIFNRITDEKIIIAQGMFYKTTHQKKEEELRKRFLKWAKKWLRLQNKK